MRIDLMNQATIFLPHLLALSTSSRLWGGENKGLMSYRLAVFDALPRTGVSESFNSFGEYQRLVNRLVDAKMIEDGTRIWWDMRLSARYPTLEKRITDICTALADTLTVAALYQWIPAMIYRLRTANQRWRIYPLICVEENRWRAQPYGITDNLVDFGLGEQVPYGYLLAEIMDMVAVDADDLGCADEVRHAREILARRSSAQNQVHIFEEALAAGVERQTALHKVVDWLIVKTVQGL